jgi:phytoene dehydrogenase-like protein
MNKYDAIIIGAGLAGLGAGIRLAHYGLKVCICERHSRIGGMNSYYHRQGMLLETGLHAMTNLARPGDPKSRPLLKMLRQLRLTLEQLKVREQHHSLIRFPERTLRFDNDFATFEASVADCFPAEIDGFRRLDRMLEEFNEVNLNNHFASARSLIGRFIKDPLLTDMLLCPTCYYGSALEDDMDFSQFAILYKSVIRQGLFRPGDGIKGWLDLLLNRYQESGGELRLNCGVSRILSKDGQVTGVLTDAGEVLSTAKVLSSAGLPETQELGELPGDARFGRVAFFESTHVFKELSESEETIVFFCNTERLTYRRPEPAVDVDSGILCYPHHFKFEPGDFRPPPTIKTSVLANPARFPAEKAAAMAEVEALTVRMTGADPGNAIFRDACTPQTIVRYTGRKEGAIYGSPDKCLTGKTALQGLYVCGIDQGFLGITGATLSGISMANLHLLL